MKRLLVFVFIFVVMAGAAYAADQTTPAADQSVATDTTTVQADQTTEEQPVKKPSTNYGLMIGLYNPIDSEVKDIFGSSWIRYGLRPLPKDLPERWRPHFDVSFYSMSHNNDNVMLIPITVGVLKGIGDQDKDTRMYMAVNAGPYYADLNAPSVGKSKTGWGINSNATVGLLFKDRLSVEARYEYMNDFAGLDFSAFTLSAAFKVFSARF